MTFESESRAEAPEGAGSRGRHSHAGHASHGNGGEPTFRNPLTALFGRRKSTVTIGDVRYFDGAELSRPLDMPPAVRYVALAAMVVAAVIGGTVLFNWVDQITNEPLRQQEALQQNLTREAPLDLPSLAALMPQSDEEMMATLTEAGYTLYERTPVGTNPEGGFDVIKLPADVSVEEAGLMYVKGIDKLSAADAVRLLKGAWTLDVSRKAGESVRLRYADFDSGTIEKAIQNAMAAEGLQNATVTDSGVDDSGNTYQTGTVVTEGGSTYTWRVSVIDLAKVYSIAGLPNTAYYVGIRFSA